MLSTRLIVRSTCIILLSVLILELVLSLLFVLILELKAPRPKIFLRIQLFQEKSGSRSCHTRYILIPTCFGHVTGLIPSLIYNSIIEVVARGIIRCRTWRLDGSFYGMSLYYIFIFAHFFFYFLYNIIRLTFLLFNNLLNIVIINNLWK